MSINIQELVNFNVDGLNELLSETQKYQLIEYQKQLHILQDELKNVQDEINRMMKYEPTKTFTTIKNVVCTRKLLAVDVDYTLEQKAKIFLSGKTNYKLWFLNKANKLCLVTNTKVTDSSVFLSIFLDVKGYQKETYMSLDRFLHLIELGEFKILNKKFIAIYLKPYYESKYVQKILNQLNFQKETIEKEINSILNSTFYKTVEELYTQKQKAIDHEFYAAVKNLTRDVEAEKATRKKAKCKKAQNTIKNLWDNVVTNIDKAYFVGWLCSHIDNIYLKVVKGGVSDKVISESYPDDIYGSKYREKANSSGWDASSGKIRFTDIFDAPISTIEALSTAKHVARSSNKGAAIFKDRTLSNLDLCLFILGNYQKYGFRSGVKNLNKLIDYEKLRDECFPGYYAAFMEGFES